MAIAVLHEDADCVVINKPAGMPSHSLKASHLFSAFDAVCELYPEIALASANPLEGGLVHRLDTGTSGCLVFARNPIAYAKLRHAFSKGLIEKTYTARVEGAIKEPILIDYPIAHHPKNKAKMVAITPKNKYFRGKPKPARTMVTPACPPDRQQTQTVVRVQIQGGRRHQIRVHLAAIGHPLVGDVLYGAKPDPGQLWHSLHAESVTLPSGQTVVAAC